MDKIFFKPISEDEMISIAKKWFLVHGGIKMTDWSEKLRSMSFDFKAVKIPKHIIDGFWMLFDRKINEHEYKTMFTQWLLPNISEYNDDSGFFVKLITRSAKDAWENDGKMKCVDDVLNSFFCSMRIVDDVAMLQRIPDDCYLIIRPFIDIPKHAEWRVFVENTSIMGISQYDYINKYDVLVENVGKCESRIINFVQKLIPNVSIPTFVADIVYDPISDNEPFMIELNPWGLSDPCLYKTYDAFDGSIKVLDSTS